MYTIGTSSLSWIAEQPGIPAPILNALDGKMVAFVGTNVELYGNGTTILPTKITPYVIYFEVPAISTGSPIAVKPMTSATVYVPNPPGLVPTGWLNVGTLDQFLVANVLVPAGGYINALYAFGRGNLVDKATAFRVDGLPYYARDDESLWVFDKNANDYIKIAYSDPIPVGSMLGWPFVKTPPKGFLHTDGTVLNIVPPYEDLYVAIGKTYEVAISPTPATAFRLPLVSNMAIRYMH
jgi:hypothetical protein